MAQEMQPIEENYPALDINLSLTFSSQGYNSIGSVEPIRKYTKPILPSGLVKTPDNDEEEESIPIENKDGLIYFYSQETHPLCARENDAREIIRTQNLQVSDNQLTELLRPERQQVVNPAEAQQLPPCQLYTCKMLICVTMYAEDLDMLQKTLFHIQRNLDEFKKAGVDPKQVVVVVLQDGILKMKEETARWMAELENGYNYTQSIQRRQEHYQMKDFKNVIDRRRLLQSEILKYQLSGLKQYVEKNSGLPPNLPSRTALLYQVRKDYSRFLPDYKQQFKNVDPNSYIPLTTFFLNKHLNARKLSSHLWFFEGFCKFFTPQYITLVDVGTLPERTGIAEYFYAMERDKSLGGASGYMGLYMKDEEDAKVRAALDVNQRTEFDRKLQEEEARENQPFELRKRYEEERDKQKIESITDEALQQKIIEVQEMKLKSYQRVECLCIPFTQVIILLRFVYNLISTCLSGIGLFLLNCLNCSTVRCFDLRKAQLFEYTIAHMIDKNFESALDFLHVLPGAWSCYRYEALQCREKLKKNVLQEYYLKTVLHPDKGLADFKEANMYLAEDRILCLAIFTQENKDYTLKYIPKAEAKTDAIEDLIEFMNQRRRWINSTWFALEYVLRNYWVNLEKSGHSRVTKWVKTPISMLFARLGKINAYIQLSLMYFVIHFSCFEFLKSSIQDKSLFLSVLPGLIPFFYVLMVIFLVLISLFYKVSNPTLQRPPDSRFPDQKTKIKRILSLMDPGISSSLSQTFSDLENQLQYVCFFILNLLSEKQQQKYQDIYVHEQQKRKLAPQNEINNHQIVIQDRGEETLQYQNELNKIKGQLKEDYKREDLDFQMLTEGFANDQEACFNIFLQLGLYYISGQTLDFIKLADLRQITRDIILFRNNQQVLRFLKIDIKAALTIDQIIEYFFGKSKQTELQDKYEEGLKKYDISILTNKVFTVISSILGYYYLLLWGMIINTVVGNYIITQKNETSLIILGGMIGISIGSVFLIICFHLVSPRRVWDIVRSTISYIYFSGCYTHTLIVYAFCNIDDVGWGTKGISSNVDNSYRQAKLNFVSTWLFCNALIAFLLILLDQFLNSSPYILYALGVYASFIMGVRFIFAAWYHWKYYSSQFFLCFISLPQQNKEKFDLEWASYQINNSKNVPKKRQRQGNITQN